MKLALKLSLNLSEVFCSEAKIGICFGKKVPGELPREPFYLPEGGESLDAADVGGEDANVRESGGIDGRGVAIEDDEVGQLAGDEPSFFVLFVRGIGAAGCIGSDGCFCADTLVGTDEGAAAGAAVDSSVEAFDWLVLGDRIIGVHREEDAHIEGCFCRHDHRQAFGTIGQELVAEFIGIGVEDGNDTILFDPVEDGLVGDAAMFDPVTYIRGGGMGLRILIGGKYHIYLPVSIGMAGDLQTCLLNFQDQAIEGGLAAGGRDTVIIFLAGDRVDCIVRFV